MVAPAEKTLTSKVDLKQLFTYEHGKISAFVVNSDTDVDVNAIDVRRFKELLLQLTNAHATNGLIYTLYATVDESDTPPDFAATPNLWQALSGQTGTISAGNSAIEKITDAYAWVLIRVKREVSLNNSTLDVSIRAKRG